MKRGAGLHFHGPFLFGVQKVSRYDRVVDHHDTPLGQFSGHQLFDDFRASHFEAISRLLWDSFRVCFRGLRCLRVVLGHALWRLHYCSAHVLKLLGSRRNARAGRHRAKEP